MGQWLDELEQAYQAKNMDQIGTLIDRMKQQRQQFQGRGGGRDLGGPSPGMPGGMRGPGGARGRFGGQGIENKPPVGKTDFEKKVLAVLDDMNQNQSRGMMNVPPVDGRLLRLLAETTGAKHIVEIGTSNGYSGIWQCLALKATDGKLTTFEIDAGRAALARQNFAKAGVDDIVTLIEGDAHEKVTDLSGPIDIVFLDADKEGYVDYLNKLLPKVRPGGLVIAHNINAGQADPRYIEAITGQADLETVFYQQGGGVSITMKKSGRP
jgi:predicted O-methyltransferase YrrM